MEERLPRKLAAILYADVAGYSRLTGEDEEGTHRRLSEYLDLISGAIEGHQGRVVHYAGDAVLADFGTVTEALTCATAIQSKLANRNKDVPDERKVQFRMGVNLGEVIVDRDDIYGDGVNVAARLESLAEPGGICISESVRAAVGKKLDVDYEYLGEQKVKNIAEPVRAYRVVLETGVAAAPRPRLPRWRLMAATAVVAVLIVVGVVAWWQRWQPREEPASAERMTFPLPDKPSIAVLPFTNMSGDTEQEYFVDGMTEDLITDLSKLSGLFVIARNSTFTYRGKSVQVRQVAEELGVRYVLEGSVRRDGERVRINAQLVDALTGGHLWAERYDAALEDVFALQDRVTRKIVTALSVNLTPEEEQRRIRRYTNNVQAYDAFLRGWDLWSFDSPEEFAQTVQNLEKALELDPTYGRAHAALAELYLNLTKRERESAVGVSHDLAKMLVYSHIKEAMKYPTPLAHRVRANVLARQGRWDDAIAEAERAIGLNPNDPDGYAGMSDLLIKLGRPAEAQIYLNEASRLNPLAHYGWLRASVQFHLERFEEAVETLRINIEHEPNHEWLYLLLAASYGHLGREAEGQAAIGKFEEIRAQKGHSKSYASTGLYDWTFEDKATRERIREGLLKAGMP